VTDPFLEVAHTSPPDPERCAATLTFLTGIAFSGDAYPSGWANSLYVTDAGSGCLWAMPRDLTGAPDPGSLRTFPVRLLGAVALIDGPNGELYYPNLYVGRIHRLRSDPTIVFADDFEYGTYRWGGVVGDAGEATAIVKGAIESSAALIGDSRIPTAP
jgi:hypothetical protein